MSSNRFSAVAKASLVAFYLAFSLLVLDLGASWSVESLLGLDVWFLWLMAGLLAVPIAWVSGAIFLRVLRDEGSPPSNVSDS